MYMVYIIDHIHRLFNESKKSLFTFNNDRMEYIHWSEFEFQIPCLFMFSYFIKKNKHYYFSKKMI